MLEEYKDVLTVKDLESILPISAVSIYKLLKTGKIKSFRVGKKILIPKQNLIKYLEE